MICSTKKVIQNPLDMNNIFLGRMQERDLFPEDEVVVYELSSSRSQECTQVFT